MPKEEWGVKRVCPTTGKRFYDMNRSPVVSPYTGEAVNVDTGTKTRILVADKDDADSKKAKADDDLLLDDDDVELEEDDTEEDDTDVVLDDDDDSDTVSLDEIADVGGDDDDE
ncbi:TIGR02300 family protein [Jannaschia sp. S6380]|uniref:TIGR02300 family protein n=1 Tax=Jannaschia sp. S6380 TaxID=2926408 RepID=UPI001FF64455|nr:TIGR02300 family protein [Jannaschia sp. S6380]MCK0168174.1 TIGR02300 family protein [Jannaschia sp. S6380]